ncbi:hypothetical protein C7T94_18275 [Pedobacter yulinensis]|uniref:Beta-xylosidase n=1 Tax=Pedobacter yulinensis TaxID=2126353 RepID=A0A2T3HH91_9SPHI|nr:hypothetical protein [Pedobacter yulinensis]PST81815.1 hypothetical protein C7T94_18275 [Pedobacter yulinensis]
MVRTRYSFLLLLVLLCSGSCKSVVSVPDDDTNQPQTEPGTFLYGSNMGYYPGWSDEQLAEILIGNPAKNIAGSGVNSLRAAMYDHFVQQWGYDIRRTAFQTYAQLGGRDHTIFLNGPADQHREQTSYCKGVQSQTFANLYEPIWTSPGNINTKNYYANYVYNVVKTYGPYVKYWEVWNEPDYTTNWAASQTWDRSDPNPCDLSNFSAPVQSYVRMLRITSEIVSQLDKDALVCVGGLGYPGFLDAILRNTDNPDGGRVTADYPKKGGDWFRCLSYHVYPMYDLGSNRNSDAAARAIVNHKTEFEAVLNKYGYGASPGRKTFIVTETNIPRKAVGNYVGGEEVQRNFMIKAAVAAQKAGINSLYIYGAAESELSEEVTEPFQAMGLYKKITEGPYTTGITPGGTAWRTVSRLLGGRKYDAAATAALQLPDNADGAAFYSATQQNHLYVLWARTSGSSEHATVSYRFPAAMNVRSAKQINWEQAKTEFTGTLTLTGAPVFIQP